MQLRSVDLLTSHSAACVLILDWITDVVYVVGSFSNKCFIFHSCVDLVAKENVEKWLKYLRNEFPTIPFKASTQLQSDRLVIPHYFHFHFVTSDWCW